MTFKSIVPVFLLFLVVLSPSACGQTWQEQFIAVESMIERGEIDSAKSLLERAVEQEETRSGRSDSTVDIEFFSQGVSYRLYYSSYSEADSLYTRLVTIGEKLYESGGTRFAGYLRKRGRVYTTLGRYREAEATYRRALSTVEQAFGLNSDETVGYLNDLGDVLCILAEYEEADSVSRKALEISEDIQGPDHPSVARSLDIVSQVLMSREADDEAEGMLERSLTIRESHHGPDHPDVAKSLLLLGKYYAGIRKMEEAGAALTRLQEIRETAFGPEHPEVAQNLIYLSEYRSRLYRNDDNPEKLASRAISILKKTYGPGHPLTAAAELRLAYTKANDSKLEDAIAIAQRTLPVLERALGRNHPSVASANKVIAVAKLHLNQIGESMAYWERVVAIVAAQENPKMSRLLENISNLHHCYILLGLADKADSLLETARSLSDSTKTPRRAAEVLFEVGGMYFYSGRTVEARDMFYRALALCDSISSDIEILRLNVLLLIQDTWMSDNEYEEARRLMRQLLPLAKELFGAESQAYASCLRDAAYLYMEENKCDLAAETLLKVYSIYEQTCGPDHFVTAVALFYLGATHSAIGKYEKSTEFFEKFWAAKQRFVRTVFGTSSESQKARQVSRIGHVIDEVISLALARNTSDLQTLALDVGLKEKAVIEEASMKERRAAYCSDDSETAHQIDLLKQIRTMVANLTLSHSADRDSLSSLYNTNDSLEMELSRNCSQFKDEMGLRDFEVADVAECVAEDAVLLELLEYYPVRFDSAYFADRLRSYDEPRYAALTLTARNEISVTDLGPRAKIDSLVSLAREMLYDAHGMIYSTKASVAEQRLSEVTRQLRELVLDPLNAQLAGKTSLCISPDGMLNLLPFEILPTQDGSYLIENYRISYLSSGRDLLRYRQQPEVSEHVVVMADPDFNWSPPTDTSSWLSPVAASEDTPPEFVQMLRSTEGCLGGSVGRLSHSLEEGEHIAEGFRRLSPRPTKEFYGSQASEGCLKEMEIAPGILHLATHGYFCTYSEDLSSNLENPLLRSGLLLAGCNSTIGDEPRSSMTTEDGVLTAYEVSGLNLDGTELVTLSACESGMAEGYTCEGLYGLRRAFQYAGAQSVIMSLWKVPDRKTRHLMEGFYDRWLSGSSKQDALRGSALELLRSCREQLGCGHPLLWGGFILTGNPN